MAAIYDDIDGDRSDLEQYEAIVSDFRAASVLDVGCGTGVFACSMARRRLTVTAADPAAASLDVARAKPSADLVEWLHTDAARLPTMCVDMATMTGNVAQVFLTDDAWRAAIRGVHRAIRPGGHLVFETRDPARRDWEEWDDRPGTVKQTARGPVEHSTEVTAVELPLVSFRHSYRFLSDGSVLTSDSTLRFRDRDEVEASLAATGYDLVEVRDAPGRPRREFVFIAIRRPDR